MSESGRSANPGLLGPLAASRPSFLRYLVLLYKSDAAFRGVVDFAVIGTIVLAFLFFAPSREPPPVKKAQTTTSGATTSQATATEKPATEKPATSTTSSTTAGAPLDYAIPYPNEVTDPSQRDFIVVDIDETAFRRSAPPDQQKLAAAARAFRSQQFAEMATTLSDCAPADPNVAFMRGLAALNAGAEQAKSAAELFRSAADAGHHQASIMLGRLLVRPMAGGAKDAKDVARGRQLIETAAAGGDRLAQRLAGIGYLSDDFGGVNPAKARELFRTAAQAGDPTAMLFYSMMLDLALGGPADQPAAADLLRRAAAAGLTRAQETAGAWLLGRYRRGSTDDPREGVEWLEKARQNGHSLYAAQLLMTFHADDKLPAPWHDKSKVFELATESATPGTGGCFNTASAPTAIS
jgi:TPR repeat protein